MEQQYYSLFSIFFSEEVTLHTRMIDIFILSEIYFSTFLLWKLEMIKWRLENTSWENYKITVYTWIQNGCSDVI